MGTEGGGDGKGGGCHIRHKLVFVYLHSVSFLLPLIQEGQLSITGESMCTKYWLTAYEVQACPDKIVVRLTDRPDKTIDIYRKNNNYTKTNLHSASD